MRRAALALVLVLALLVGVLLLLTRARSLKEPPPLRPDATVEEKLDWSARKKLLEKEAQRFLELEFPDAVERDLLGALRCGIVDLKSELFRRRVRLHQLHRLSLHGDPTGEEEEAIRREQADQVLWFIGNAPDDPCVGGSAARMGPVLNPDGYEEARAAFEALVADPNCPSGVLAQYARWGTIHQRGRSVELLAELQAREPDNPKWPQEEARMHMLDLSSGEIVGDPGASDSARMAQEALAMALPHTEGQERKRTLADAMQAAAIAGDFDAVEDWGEELLALEVGRWDTTALHTAHESLGIAALGRGDTEGAIAELMQMAAVGLGPPHAYGGPNGRLASQLLQAGERDAVIAWMESMRAHWKPDRVDAFLADLRAGEDPWGWMYRPR